MKSFKPIYLLYLIPFSLVGMVVYFISIVWSELSIFIASIMVSLVILAAFIITRNILRNFHPDYGIVDERAETLQLILDSIENKKGKFSDTELDDIITKANTISNLNLRPAEKRLKLNALLKKNIKTNKNN